MCCFIVQKQNFSNFVFTTLQHTDTNFVIENFNFQLVLYQNFIKRKAKINHG